MGLGAAERLGNMGSTERWAKVALTHTAKE